MRILFSLHSVFRDLYLNGLYPDHKIILRDAQGEILLDIHKTILIIQCPYFEKTWSFKAEPVPNPLVINVVDAAIAQKVIESLYGIEYIPATSIDTLTYVFLRDFFSLPNDYRDLAFIHIPEEYYELVLKVMYQFAPCDEIARILNRVFFPIEAVTSDAISFLRENDLEITPEIEKLMIEQDLRYEIIMQISGNNILIYDTFQEKYLKFMEKADEYMGYSVACSVDKSNVVLGKFSVNDFNDKRIEKYCTKDGMLIETYEYDCENVGKICLSPDNSIIISDTEINEFTIWRNNK